VRNLALRTKLLGALLAVGLLTLLVTGWQAYRRAEAALQQAAINHLTSIREERRLQIEAYFASVRQDGLRLAESREIIDAMQEFKDAHRVFEAEVAHWPQDTRDRYRADVERY
jgi:methyl-accepting chemotaxis protein